jgi:hypothetical protein
MIDTSECESPSLPPSLMSRSCRWSILWSRVGIEVSPLTQFDIVSAPVLALSSLSLTRPSPRSPSPRRLSSAAPSPMVHLLAASTESGLIYFWRLPSSPTQQLPTASPVAPISMIHSSKFPLVNLALSIVLEDDQPTPSLLAIASDVQGAVRIHLSPLVSGIFDLSQPTIKSQPGSEVPSDRGDSLLFTLQGQASYDAPVISCRFIDRCRENLELSIFLLSGEMKIYPIRDLLRSSRTPSVEEDGERDPILRSSDLSGSPEPSAEEFDFQGNTSSRGLEHDPDENLIPAPPPTPISPPRLSSSSLLLSSPAPEARGVPTVRTGPSSPNSLPPKKSPSPSKGATVSVKRTSGRSHAPLNVAQATSPAAPVVPSEFSEPSLHTSKVPSLPDDPMTPHLRHWHRICRLTRPSVTPRWM